MAPPMDSNYRDVHPKKRTYEELETENKALETENNGLQKRFRRLQHDIQDEIEQELLTLKPRFTGKTSLDVLKKFGFKLHATIVTRGGDKIDLNGDL